VIKIRTRTKGHGKDTDSVPPAVATISREIPAAVATNPRGHTLLTVGAAVITTVAGLTSLATGLLCLRAARAHRLGRPAKTSSAEPAPPGS